MDKESTTTESPMYRTELLRHKLGLTEELERLAMRAAQTQAELTAAIQTASRGGLSNREIAKAAGLSHPTIAKIIAEPARYGGQEPA
jgi:DNA-binding NarL/FixJ family response regulator